MQIFCECLYQGCVWCVAQIRFSKKYWIQEAGQKEVFFKKPQKRIFCSLTLKVKKINMNLINFCVCSLLKILFFTNFVAAELNLHWNIPFEKLSEESGYTHLDRHSIVRDLSLTQAKEENRILPIILIKGRYQMVYNFNWWTYLVRLQFNDLVHSHSYKKEAWYC